MLSGRNNNEIGQTACLILLWSKKQNIYQKLERILYEEFDFKYVA